MHFERDENEGIAVKVLMISARCAFFNDTYVVQST